MTTRIRYTAAIVVLVGVEQGISAAMILSLFRVVRHSYHPHTAVLVNDERVRDVKTILVLVITAMLIAVPSSASQGHAIRSRAGWSGELRPMSATQLEVG